MKRDQIEITSVKVLQKTVAMCHNKIGDTKETTEIDKKFTHPDFTTALALLKPALAEVHYLPKNKIDNVSITGFSLSGKENCNVIINGTLKTPDKKVVAINSPAILIAENKYSFVETLGACIESITDEAYEYFFKGKTGQEEMKFEEREEEEK